MSGSSLKYFLLNGIFYLLFLSSGVCSIYAQNPPVAIGDSANIHGAGFFNVLENDQPGPNYLFLSEIITPPSNGIINIQASNGTIHYIANTGFTGADTLVYKTCLHSANWMCSQATVSINVHNQPPVAVDDPVIVRDFGEVYFLANDYDPDGDEFHSNGCPPYQSAPVTKGNLSLIYGGGWRFDRSPNKSGYDEWTYQIGDGLGGCAVGTVSFFLVALDGAENAGETCELQSKGEPVNVTNGNMWLRQTDYSLSGIGEHIEISRFYNSIIQASGLFGFGWSTGYDESIESIDNKMLRLNIPDGRAIYFGRKNTTDPFVPIATDFHGSVIKNFDNTYTLILKDGRSHKYDINGRLMWQKDRNGNQTTLSYDANGRLYGVTDAAGRILTITLNTNGTVASISDSSGTIATYDYEPNTTLLKTVTYTNGSKYKFEYDTTTVAGKIFLKTVKDALDNVLETHQYDSSGRATTSEKHGGVEKYTFDFTHIDDVYPYTTVTDALGRVAKYTYSKSKGHNVVTKVEGNCNCGGGSEVTTYEYDDKLSLKKKTDALNRQTTYTYNAAGDLLTMTDLWGTSAFTYNNFGQVLTYTDRMNGTWTNTYDANGNLKTSKDALNNITTIDYPLTNNKGLPDSIKDARNNVTKFKWFAGSGLLQEIEDANGKKTNFTYDARARTKTVTNALTHTITYNYFDDTQRKVEMIYPNSDKITYKYDVRRLLESVTDERGKVTSYEFDSAYRLKKITDPLSHIKELDYDLMSNVKWTKDALGNQTDFLYDNFNRLKEVQYPLAETGATRLVEKFEYDAVGRIKKFYDTANRLTEYGYDDINRTNTVTNAEFEVTTTKYNQRFQNIEVKDALNQIYTFGYDSLGRQLTQTRAGGVMSYEYDAVGNRTKRTDYIGRITDYEYDNLNRLKKILYGGQSAANNPSNQEAVYTYDDISRLKTAANETGTVTLNYDNRNRPTSTVDVFGHTVAYEYELTSTVNQKRLKFDGAMYATYNFDDADRLSNIADSNDSTTISFGYDNADRLTSKTLPNSITTTYDYDGMSRLKRLKDVSSTATLFDRQYSYNNASQINQIVEPSNTRTIGYDPVNRLTSVTASNNQNESYSFDDVGNRTASHKSASYAYQTGQFNRVASTATANYDYDANGNMTKKSEGSNLWRYVWDYENRLVSASTRKQSVRYKYDALGRRVQRYFLKGGRENTKFIYDGQDVLVDDNSGTLTKYQNGLGIDNKLKVSLNGSAKYFLADHLGSTNGLTDASGNLTESASYDSFGNATGNLNTRYQFTGREFDNFTGLHYYRARFYDANLGRFISEDPIGFAGGDVNLYGYVKNKPLNFYDPFGLDEYAMMERFANTQPSKRSIDEMLDDAQLMLGSLGLTPVVGEPADAVDGLISLARGNYGDAALSGSSMLPFLGTAAGTTKVCKRLQKLQSKFDNLAESSLLTKYRKIDPDLKSGYTGSFKTGVVGNPNKSTFGQPTDLDNFDIDFWIESDILYNQKGSGLKADPDFRKILNTTPGFEGLKPNKNGFSIKFKPSKK